MTEAHQAALLRCVARLRQVAPVVGVRNPRIGRDDNTWEYCGPHDWVLGFHSGQLWLAAQLTGDPAFVVQAQARRPAFRHLLDHPEHTDHDLGFQFSLSCVADWNVTGNTEARDLALRAAELLAGRFNEAGGFINAWNPWPGDPARTEFNAGRMIADCMENLALLHWATGQTGDERFRQVADAHARTTARHLVRPDGTAYHTFGFDPVTGRPLGGRTHQGYADESCWSRGQAWLVHGFAQCYLHTGDPAHLDTAVRVAAATEQLLGDDRVPLWDLRLPTGEPQWRDSSAGAILAAGLHILASVTDGEQRVRWRTLADRLLDGLLETCDLTGDPHAQGMLAHGASFVRKGKHDNMLPYGDYFFMEALMRSLGHTAFFWM